MFQNKKLGEIFLINSHNNIIHAASKLSGACGINGNENGRFGILPCDDVYERQMMLQQFAIEYPQLSLCPHCFAEELHKEEGIQATTQECSNKSVHSHMQPNKA